MLNNTPVYPAKIKIKNSDNFFPGYRNNPELTLELEYLLMLQSGRRRFDADLDAAGA